MKTCNRKCVYTQSDLTVFGVLRNVEGLGEVMGVYTRISVYPVLTVSGALSEGSGLIRIVSVKVCGERRMKD